MPGTLRAMGNTREIFMIAPSLTPSALTASTTTSQSFTVRGLLVGDQVAVNSDAAQTAAVGIANTRVTATDTLQITFSNSGAGTPTPVAGLYDMVVHRPEYLPLPTSAV